jgi:hypothetical protein
VAPRTTADFTTNVLLQLVILPQSTKWIMNIA